MLEAMIDIETFDTQRTAVVFQVGLVLFDKDHVEHFNRTWNLNVDEQLANGRTMSASTIAFHMNIPANAMQSLNGITVSVDVLRKQLDDIFAVHDVSAIWSKGSFDFNIIEDLMGEKPWPFWAERELRTLMSECGVLKGDVKHTAIDDCRAQVEQLSCCRGVIS